MAKVGKSRVEMFTDLSEAASKMTIVELTSEPAVREMTEDIVEKAKVKFIDLRYQLVIWKKTDFLLDNIAFSQELCDALVNEGIFNGDMMGQIMRPTYDVERCLMMLTLLGTHGDDVYEGFLRALKRSKQNGVVQELRKTERFTKYGETLPSVFHYFLNLSEFLKKYPHIAVKLGEEEKHLLQSFIDGHIDVGIRKNKEKVFKMENKIIKLKDQIRQLKAEIKVRAAHELELEEALRRANAKIDEYRNRVQEAEDISMEHRNEARKLRHFRTQQEELVKFICDKSQELKMPDFGPRELTRQLSNMRSMLDRQKTQISKLMIEKQGTEIDTRKVSVGSRQTSKLGSRQNTKLQLTSNNPDAYLTSLRMNQTQLNLLANKVYYSLLSVQSLEREENRLKILLDQEGHNKAYRLDMRRLLADIKKEKKIVKDQLTAQERELYHKENEVLLMRKDVLGVGSTPADVQFYKTQHDSLISQIQNLLNHIKYLHSEDMKEEERRREKIIADYLQHIQDLKNKHIEDIGKLKLKIRMKISEIYDREKLLARLKKQITTMVNYHSKNMNASIPVEECRKITRSMIGEARKLKAIAEEKERDKAELERLEAIGDDDAIKLFHEKKMRAEERKKKRDAKRGWKKKQSYMADDRLRYVGDRLCLEWRVLGKCIGLTNNRMDMIEWDCPPNAKQDQIAFAMLKAWRDEEKGRIVELIEGLRQMAREDLAMIVMPIDRMHLLDKKKKKGEGSDEEEEEEEDEEDEDDDEEKDEVGLTDIDADVDSETKSTARSKVPKLPAIKGTDKAGSKDNKKKKKPTKKKK